MEQPLHSRLLIGRLLTAPAVRNPEESLFDAAGNGGAGRRLSYGQLQDRIARLGAALARLGLGPGATVAVMDWDSVRYLECFFAVPMLGATLHTVNIRFSPEQVLYTINHAEDDAILCHADFLPLLLPLLPRIHRPVRLVLLSDAPGAVPPEGFAGEYEALLAAEAGDFAFPDLAEDARATLFYTTGTTGDLPKWAAPERICRVEALPKTSVGKIDKKRIRKMLAAGEIA